MKSAQVALVRPDAANASSMKYLNSFHKLHEEILAKYYIKWKYRGKYALVATLLVFMVMYDRAGRHKQRSLTGPMVIDVKHLDSGNDFITNQEMREKITKKFSSDFTKVPIEKLDVPEIESQLKSLDFYQIYRCICRCNNRLNILVKRKTRAFV